jgi:hypothetical protein
MNNEINLITQQLFNKGSLADLTVSELEAFIGTYPYVASARFLLAKKEYDAYPSAVHDDIVTAGLYFNNPLWFEWQLRRDLEEEQEPVEKVQEPVADVAPVIEPEKPAPAVTAKNPEPAFEFQSYHTIDYFASQGIRLQQTELTKDRLGQQLKSFTEWLKSMKKLPAVESENVQNPDDTKRQQAVIMNAAVSIEEKEVVTEAMAEVWAKQGNHEKAIETYHKLGLLNPAKNAYFASKIEQLKQV